MSVNDTITIQDFIAANGITMSASPLANRSDRDTSDEWAKTASHWLCKITCNGRDMVCEYSMGSGHRVWKRSPLVSDWSEHDRKRFGYKVGERVGQLFLSQKSQWAARIREELTEPIRPALADVLDSLAGDAGGYDNARNFADWASDFGLDTDSIKAEKMYRACGEAAKNLRWTLGAAAYESLLANVERL